MTIYGEILLDRAFLSLAKNPSQYISFGTAGSIGGGGTRNEENTLEGDYRQYANNVTKLIKGTNQSKTLAFVFRALTAPQVATVKSWIGSTCLFRDTYGRRVYGSYIVTDETDIPLSGKALSTLQTDMAITFVQLTFNEAV